MRLSDLLMLAFGNLGRAKLRVAMSAMGVLIGTAAVVLLVSLGVGLQRSATESLGNLGDLTLLRILGRTEFAGPGVGPPTDIPRLTDAVIADIRKIPGVRDVTPLVRLNAAPARLRVRNRETIAFVQGVDATAFHRMGFEVSDGRLRLGRGEVVVGALVPRMLASTPLGPRGRPARTSETPPLVGRTVELIFEVFPTEGLPPRPGGPPPKPRTYVVRVRVAGVLKPAGGDLDQAIFMDLQEIRRLNQRLAGRTPNWRREGYPQLLVRAVDVEHAAQVEQTLTRKGFIVFSARTAMQGIRTFFLVLQGLLGGLGGIALLVAAFGIANTMVMAIYERTREIGLLKAMGATNRDVMLLFLTESGAIGFLGGLAGNAVGWLGGQVADAVVGAYLARQTVMQSGAAEVPRISFIHTPIWLLLLALVFAWLVGVAAGIYPAMRAANLDPVQALRYE